MGTVMWRIDNIIPCTYLSNVYTGKKENQLVVGIIGNWIYCPSQYSYRVSWTIITTKYLWTAVYILWTNFTINISQLIKLLSKHLKINLKKNQSTSIQIIQIQLFKWKWGLTTKLNGFHILPMIHKLYITCVFLALKRFQADFLTIVYFFSSENESRNWIILLHFDEIKFYVCHRIILKIEKKVIVLSL